MDVNYLLQRLEEYSGLVILATNYKKQLDEALLRKIRFVVEFP
jgi:SpoVK/Ycf46/Vps4 family AAA+-type ATPase